MEKGASNIVRLQSYTCKATIDNEFLDRQTILKRTILFNECHEWLTQESLHRPCQNKGMPGCLLWAIHTHGSLTRQALCEGPQGRRPSMEIALAVHF